MVLIDLQMLNQIMKKLETMEIVINKKNRAPFIIQFRKKQYSEEYKSITYAGADYVK